MASSDFGSTRSVQVHRTYSNIDLQASTHGSKDSINCLLMSFRAHHDKRILSLHDDIFLQCFLCTPLLTTRSDDVLIDHINDNTIIHELDLSSIIYD